jgi:hypothetical protein
MSHGGGGVFGLNELFVSGATIPTQFVEVGLNPNSRCFHVLLLFSSHVSTSQFVRDKRLALSSEKRKLTVPIFSKQYYIIIIIIIVIINTYY